MKTTYDPDKISINIKQRQLSFESVAEFDLDTALIQADDRKEYGEAVLCSLGFAPWPSPCASVHLAADSLRVISFCKANKREMKRYEAAQ